MISQMRFSRRSRGLVLMGICLLILSAVPARQAAAAFKDQPLDNTLTDFARGTFQRASLGAVRKVGIPNQKITDEKGAVQLGPIGLLRNWKKLPSFLPSELAAMGTASIGNRLFIIGGLKPGGTATAEVWSAAVNTTTGGFLDPGWQQEPSLLAVHGSNSLDVGATVAELSSPAVASIPKAGGGGYIYVIGGTIPQGTRQLSSYSVQRAEVGVNGRIVGQWQEMILAKIPSPILNDPFAQLGLTAAAATTFTTQSGRTFIYLIGGLEQYVEGTGGGAIVKSQGTRRTFYAEVGSDGRLFKPSSNRSTEGWDMIASLPDDASIPPEGGLWNSVAVADHFLKSVGGFGDALYVIGGLKTTNVASEVIYRALIDGSTGALTWTTASGPDIWTGTLPQARSGHGGVVFRGNIYLTSGQQLGNVNPDWSILTTYVEDNLQLHNWGINGSDFLENPNALTGQNNGPDTPRTGHGTVLVQAGPDAPNTAFLYIIGGRGRVDDGDTSDDDGSDDVVMAKIGGDEDIKDTGYAPDGLYYSKPYQIIFDQAELRQISWATQITRTTGLENDDIALDYRVSSDSNCNAPTWTETSWQPLDGAQADLNHASIDGQNIVDIISVPARCFQYRARLTSSADLKQTPSLLNISIRIFVPGGPDLSVKTLSDRRGANNSFTGLNVVIQNVNLSAPPTLSADTDGGGSFSVDLCIYGPNASGPAPTLPLTPSNKQCSKAFANVAKSVLGPNAVYPITRWFDTNTEQPVELISYFQQPGTYTVYAAVDSFVNDATQFPKGFVDEGDQGEGNNVSRELTFQVQSVGHGIYLAQMRR
jgi:hypothetical protein